MVGSLCRVIALTVMAASAFLPVSALAGSATSLWDLSLEGMVKLDYGYASQEVGPDADLAQRKSGPGAENALDETGNQFWAAGETRLNFLAKGPAVGTARSSAFVEGDFRGQYSNSSYGTFTLRHAYMKLDWPGTSLLVGQTWQPWGIFPYLWILKYDEDGPWNRGVRIPQIVVSHQLSKEFSLTGGIASPANVLGSQQVNNTANSNTTSNWPDFTGELRWKAERYGRIGEWPLEVGAGGFIGSRKIEYNRATGVPVPDQITFNAAGVPGSSFDDKNVLAWALSLRCFIPIIPEKEQGKQDGALAFVFAGFTGQNMTNYITLGTSPYNRDGVPTDFNAAVVSGGWAQLIYYITDRLSVSGQIAHAVSNMSRTLRNGQPDAVYEADRYLANVIYDLNAAIRLGIEGSYVRTTYGAPVNGLAGWGAFYSARVAAYYFF